MDKINLLTAKFIEYLKSRDFSQKTVKDYKCQLGFFKRYLEQIKITEVNQITKEIIHNYQMSLFNPAPLRGAGQVQEEPRSLQTQRGRLVALRSFFRYLAKSNQILYDPAVELELPKTRKNIPRDIMTKKEIQKVLNAPNPDTALGLRDKAILELLYSTGIRNQELRNLCIYDLDTTNNYVRVNQGKGKKDRVIPLGEIAANYVEEYLNHSRPKLLKQEQNTNILFLTKHGQPMKNNGLIETIKKYAAKAKLEKHITPHSFRHTCATHLLKNNASLRHIQELLGHASIESTQIYTRIDISDLKRAHKKYHPRERGD